MVSRLVRELHSLGWTYKMLPGHGEKVPFQRTCDINMWGLGPLGIRGFVYFSWGIVFLKFSTAK